MFFDDAGQDDLDLIHISQNGSAASVFLFEQTRAPASALFFRFTTRPVGGRGLCGWTENSRRVSMRISKADRRRRVFCSER
jgi:hypothetical protein